MSTTITIPKATLQPGERIIGPHAVPAGVSSFVLTVGLSQAAGGGNSFTYVLQRSEDGGTTWVDTGSGGADGGGSWPDWIIADNFSGPDGQPLAFGALQLQMVITIVGAALVVASGGELVAQ